MMQIEQTNIKEEEQEGKNKDYQPKNTFKRTFFRYISVLQYAFAERTFFVSSDLPESCSL
jgi:hypothetical protein